MTAFWDNQNSGDFSANVVNVPISFQDTSMILCLGGDSVIKGNCSHLKAIGQSVVSIG